MVEAGGQWGHYTDVETLTSPASGTVAAGTYLKTMGPGGAVYYNPSSSLAMARANADSANEYYEDLTGDVNKDCFVTGVSLGGGEVGVLPVIFGG